MWGTVGSRISAMKILAVVVVAAMGVGAGVAQEPAPATSKPAKVCVARLRNQTTAKFDLAKFREALFSGLQGSKLAKDGAASFVTIEADSSDVASDEIQKVGCDFAVYTRVLLKPKVESPRTLETGTTVEFSKVDRGDIFGLQCTVERTSSGMPVLIDRQFDTKPTTDDRGVLKLLAAESGRIEDALGKKLK